ncbi:hypothetical protein LI90_1625 [Carbonactinospora thermoautotrophica]|uniref:Uncharacterized protein n=1 Tax=Carbonactinospora thermoautotrophica TaxID=1469144 RepID=A0A132MQH1_9ACTN|nr:hypothetical protein LI90_1625 [Carbonactinospora thermoautotrophica]
MTGTRDEVSAFRQRATVEHDGPLAVGRRAVRVWKTPAARSPALFGPVRIPPSDHRARTSR